MSGRWEPPVNGSLTITTSPSSTFPAAATVASTERSIEPRCTGTCSACATSCASASKIAHDASMRSLMFGENDVRFSTAPISSAIDSSPLRNTSRVIGSTVLGRAMSFMAYPPKMTRRAEKRSAFRHLLPRKDRRNTLRSSALQFAATSRADLDDQAADGVNAGVIAWVEHLRCRDFLDDCRAGDF